ncbi:MAG: hypothetical protein NVV73_23140 [Cellvibrionaceae bacterium]|nr:hypothetical protein [Cellvibrionaceae bacterium]
MLIATVSSAAFLLVTDLSIIELDQAQLRTQQTESAKVEATTLKSDEEEVAENASDNADAVAATWARDAVKRRRKD